MTCLQENAATNATSSSQPLDPDKVGILMALLCILICMLGLVVTEQCTWICRLSSSSSSTASSTPPPQHQRYSAEAANKGIKKKTLRSLPKLTFSSCSSTNRKFSDCTICLTEFVNGNELRVLPQCGHAFHVACIDSWLGSHSSCPYCRRILVASSMPVMDRNESHSRCAQCKKFPGDFNFEHELEYRHECITYHV